MDINYYYSLGKTDGMWAQWGEWSGCSKTCGDGKKSKTRECDYSNPHCKGQECYGDNSTTVMCNEMGKYLQIMKRKQLLATQLPYVKKNIREGALGP